MEIQQGNFISQDMVAQLKLGMSKDQVRFVLGTPLITDSFHADRWDYVFRRQKPSSRELEKHRLAVFFEDAKLARIDSDVVPVASADAAAVKLPDAKPEPPAPRPVAPAQKAQAPAPGAQAPAPREAVLAPIAPAPAQRVEVPAPKPEGSAPKAEASLMPEVQKQRASGAAPETRPAPQIVADAPKMAPGASANPAAAPLPSAEGKPQEKKGWWDRIRDTVKF